ncbi:MAG: GNAT family N-acetyltransferase [Deltaproteobacteria bacterium]|nr:GNAT family N-acetyltransferase [Deltaproteobacteria bacterium]
MHPLPDGYEIDTDRTRLDIDRIWRFLHDAYWSPAIPKSIVETSIRHSECFGVYRGAEQVGFARVVTDYSTFGYIADVFVLPEHRGRGLSKALMERILSHPGLQGFRRWQLGTLDAHGLYARFGFASPTHPERHMEMADPEIYRRPAARERKSG